MQTELPTDLLEIVNDKEFFRCPGGKLKTKALFIEFEYYQKDYKYRYKPIYTFRDYDHHGVWSLKKLYLELMDPTEYMVANTLFYNWRHWQSMCSLEWFAPHLEEWRKELDIKLTSEAYHTIAQQAAEGGKEAIPAAKYLAERGWEKKGKRGRPSNEEIKGELKRQVGLKKVIDNDAARIGIIHGQDKGS